MTDDVYCIKETVITQNKEEEFCVMLITPLKWHIWQETIKPVLSILRYIKWSYIIYKYFCTCNVLWKQLFAFKTIIEWHFKKINIFISYMIGNYRKYSLFNGLTHNPTQNREKKFRAQCSMVGCTKTSRVSSGHPWDFLSAMFWYSNTHLLNF